MSKVNPDLCAATFTDIQILDTSATKCTQDNVVITNCSAEKPNKKWWHPYSIVCHFILSYRQYHLLNAAKNFYLKCGIVYERTSKQSTSEMYPGYIHHSI